MSCNALRRRAADGSARALLSLVLLITSAPWPVATLASTAQAQQERADAEKRLLDILAQIERRETNAAFRALRELTLDAPNFRAAQLLYADMLRMRTGATPAGQALAQSQATPSKRNVGVADQSIAPPEFFQGIQSELQRRRMAAIDLPPPGMVPSNFLHLSPSVRHAIAVDTSRSRLYVFSHGPQGLELIGNFYATIGRNGVKKRAEGDQRTPLGVYFVGRQIPGERLPDLYGKGALTVNYPNDWDRMLGRTGSGIWLHGVPSDQYARVPQASDGCVVLANPDISFLMESIDRRTPVLIAEKLDWVTPQWTRQPSQKQAVMQEIEQWKNAWRQGDQQQLAQLYGDAAADTANLDQYRSRLSRAGALSKLSIQDMSVYQWQEEAGEIRIVNLHVSTANGSTPTVRQYWRKQQGQWKIFSEDVLS
ncbi:MAG: murein L,D-transpeptidase family protein [Comamonas sp.]